MAPIAAGHPRRVDGSRQAAHTDGVNIGTGSRSLDHLLAAASARITRYTPTEAYSATTAGAILIDVRSDETRRREGIVPGSLHIPRTVLEWRTAPGSDVRNLHLGRLDDPVILLCDHGCSTILAAAMLTDLGYVDAGDVIGGFEAWRESGLPTAPPPLPGIAPSDS